MVSHIFSVLVLFLVNRSIGGCTGEYIINKKQSINVCNTHFFSVLNHKKKYKGECLVL